MFPADRARGSLVQREQALWRRRRRERDPCERARAFDWPASRFLGSQVPTRFFVVVYCLYRRRGIPFRRRPLLGRVRPRFDRTAAVKKKKNK